MIQFEEEFSQRCQWSNSRQSIEIPDGETACKNVNHREKCIIYRRARTLIRHRTLCNISSLHTFVIKLHSTLHFNGHRRDIFREWPRYSGMIERYIVALGWKMANSIMIAKRWKRFRLIGKYDLRSWNLLLEE